MCQRTDTTTQTKLSLTIFTLIGISLVVGCSQPKPRVTLSTEEVEAARTTNLAYPEAWLANDPDAVRILLTEDAVLMPSGGSDPRVGMTQINEFFWPDDAPVTRVTEFSMEPAEISGTPQQALVRGAMTLQFELETEAATESFRTNGTYVMLLRPKENGEWRISHYMWNHPTWQLVAREPIE